MSVPTEGEIYAQLIEHLRLAQENAATLSHLTGFQRDRPGVANGWLAVSEGLKRFQRTVIQIATGRLN
jgi:hypothetical protein